MSGGRLSFAKAWVAEEANNQALEANPANGQALGVVAHIAYDYAYDWDPADSLFLQAREASAFDAWQLEPYGAYLTAVGRYEEA